MKNLKNGSTKIICHITPGENNPRNSEGDFLRLNDGQIMFAYSYFHGDDGSDHCPCDIAAVFSRDNGESFDSEPIVLVHSSEYGVQNLMSVSLMRMKNGDLGLFFIVKTNDWCTEYILKRSNDEGKSFYSETKCMPDSFQGYYVINNSRVLRTSDGALFIPAAMHRTNFGINGTGKIDPRGSCYLFHSGDDGSTWHEMPVSFSLQDSSFSQAGLQEPGIAELSGGILYSYFRTDRMYQYESFSYDKGKTWTLPQPSKFTSPDSPMKIAKNPFTGIYYAVWNSVPNYNGKLTVVDGVWTGGRNPFVIADSSDGISFSDYQIIEDDETRGFCYPAIFFMDKDTLLLAYCSGGKKERGCLNRITIRKIAL